MVATDFSLQQKIIVVTGGGSGICLAFVRLAVALDAKIIIADLRLTSEAEEFIQGFQKQIVFFRCDVTQWEDLQNLVKVSQEKFDDVPDVYVAGAGVFEPEWSNFWTDSETERYAELDINVSHPIKLSRIAIRAFLSKNKPGVIVILASMAGLVGSYAAPLYCASKHAIVGFTKSMGQAHQDEGVKIVCLCPGMVATPLWKSPLQIAQFSYSKEIAQTAESVAETMLEIIQESKYPGGTVLQVTIEGNKVAETLQAGQMARLSGEALEAARHRSAEPIKAILNAERYDGSISLGTS